MRGIGKEMEKGRGRDGGGGGERGRERMDYRNGMEEMGCVTWSGGMVRGGEVGWSRSCYVDTWVRERHYEVEIKVVEGATAER